MGLGRSEGYVVADTAFCAGNSARVVLLVSIIFVVGQRKI
jgi:hypothetical protein